MDILEIGGSARRITILFVGLTLGSLISSGVWAAMTYGALHQADRSGQGRSAVAATTDADGIQLIACDFHDDGTIDVSATITAPDDHGRGYVVPVIFIDDDGFVAGDAMLTMTMLPPGQQARITTRGWVDPARHIQRCEIATA